VIDLDRVEGTGATGAIRVSRQADRVGRRKLATARMAAMDRSILWRAAAVQVLLITTISLVLAVALPRSFFDDWGWLTGPAAWLACAALTAWVLHLSVRGVMLGAALVGIPSAVAVVAGVHWLGVAIAIAAFAAWCAWLARRPQGVLWT
jgi:hypothetical protein